jgi:predicted permease
VPSLLARARAALARLAGLSRAAAESRDLDDEMQLHIEMQARANQRLGMDAVSALRAARASFGGSERWKEEARDEYSSRPLEDFARDVRHGARALVRQKGFSLVAILTIALGIAATVTVFGFINSVFLRPLPVAQGARLVRVYFRAAGGDYSTLSHAAYRVIRDRTTSLDMVAVHYSTAPLYVTMDGDSRELQGAVVSASYFPMLGVTPLLGRFFSAAEDSVPDRDAVVVLSYDLWRRGFGARADALGRWIGINGRNFQIIGVAPEGFNGVEPSLDINELWIPAMMLRVGYRYCDALQPGCTPTDVMGRLASGATADRVRTELQPIARELALLSNPDDTMRALTVSPALGARPGAQRQFADLARLLSAIAILLLLIACANLSSLLVVRGMSRQREIALRTSLGAGRARIVRQLLAESLLLAVPGGVVGAGLSLWTTRLLAGFFIDDDEGYIHWFEIVPDLRVLAFAALVTLAAAALFGLLPAFSSTRVGVSERIKTGGTAGPTRGRTRTALIAIQVALSLVLLVGAGLLTRSFSRIVGRQTFDSSHVTLLRLRPALVGYGPARAQAFLRKVSAALAQLPDVESVALARGSGFLWLATGRVRVTLPTYAPRAAGAEPRVEYHEVSPHFFTTLRVPVLGGREFTDQDTGGTPRVAIVNAALARRLWKDTSPLGRQVVLDDHAYQVVGVVQDHRLHNGSEAPPAMAFVPFWQNDFDPQVDARMAIRMKGDPAQAIALLRRAIAAVDPAVPVTEAMPMTGQVGASYKQVQLSGAVLVSAATLALFLSGLGLYGVVAFLVERRTREIGIRLAVGARPRSVVALFVAQGLRPMAIGSAAGLVTAFAGAHLLERWLFGVSPFDATAFVVAIVAICAVALAASLVPAMRAARIDPTVALRYE